MNREKLQALAVALGTVVLAGGITVTAWQALPDTTVADLADAGVMACPTRLVTCDWRIDADGRNILEDAGVAASGYKTLAARVKVCVSPDGGRDVVFPPMPQKAGQWAIATPYLAGCSVGPDPGGALWRVAPSMCVRRPAGAPLASCSRVDGGDQGDLNAYPRAELVGAGCEPTVCTIFAGTEAENR